MLNRARPVGLSCPVDFRKNGFTCLSVEKVRSGVAVESGSVASVYF